MSPIFAWWLVRRSLGIWVAVRAMAMLVGVVHGGPGGPTANATGGASTRIVVAAVSIGLTWLETSRNNELLLLRDLGVPPWRILAVVSTTTILLETMLALLV